MLEQFGDAGENSAVSPGKERLYSMGETTLLVGILGGPLLQQVEGEPMGDPLLIP